MKNLASAKEGKKENRQKVSHRELNLARYSLWFIIFTGALCLSILGFAQEETRRITLDNGMVIVLKENHNLPLCSMTLSVLAGSAQEGKWSGSGIAHFVEHMLFKGTKTRKVGDIFREIESYGGRIDGFTSFDYTGYKVTVPSEFAFPALDILADMVKNAAFDEQELQKEKQVVLKEIRLSYDSPQRYASRLLWQTAYSAHPYKYPILGEEEVFNRLTRKDLVQFYQDKYLPNNMVLAVAGDIKTQDFLNYAREAFKDFPRKTIAESASAIEPQQKKLRKKETEFSAELSYLLLGFHSVALEDPDLFALDVLAAILGEGESSRLYKLICHKKDLAYSLEAINYTPRQPGLFIISSLLEEKRRRRVLALILKEIERIKKRKPGEEELQAAKNKILSAILFANQTIEAQAQDLALNEAMAGDYRFTQKYIQKIKQVDSQDVLRVAKKYLNKENLNIAALIPRDKSATTKPPESSNQALRIGIENLSQERESLIAEERYILDNGLRLLIKENKDLPLISITAAFKGGLRTEDQDTNGLCNLVAQMLDKGTKTKKAAQIAYLTESRGARLSYFSGNNSFGLRLDLQSKDFDQMLALLADLITNSTFPQSELKKQKANNLARIKTQEDNIFESGTKLLKSTLFQNHPYKFLTVGNEQSLNRLNRRNLIEFYRNFCVGKNMVLAIFGDIQTKDALLKVKQYFAKLNPGKTPEINPVQEPEIKALQAASKTLPKQQSLLLMGFPGTTVANQDRFTLEIICQILSQPSGRFFTRIREEKGLAYTLGAYSVLGLDPGYLAIYVATTSENLEKVNKELFAELSSLKENPVSNQELTQAKRALLGAKMISRQTNAACALEGALDELYGLGYDYYLEYPQLINRIDGAEVTRCAKQYFDLNNYALVTVGPQ